MDKRRAVEMEILMADKLDNKLDSYLEEKTG